MYFWVGTTFVMNFKFRLEKFVHICKITFSFEVKYNIWSRKDLSKSYLSCTTSWQLSYQIPLFSLCYLFYPNQSNNFSHAQQVKLLIQNCLFSLVCRCTNEWCIYVQSNILHSGSRSFIFGTLFRANHIFKICYLFSIWLSVK